MVKMEWKAFQKEGTACMKAGREQDESEGPKDAECGGNRK